MRNSRANAEIMRYQQMIASALDATDGKEPHRVGEWRRDRQAVVLCKHCHNSLVMHRIDTKTMRRDQGDCPGFEPGEVAWREVREVYVRVP